MNRTRRHSLALTAALGSFVALATAAHAEQKGCVELKTLAEREQEYTNEQGQKATRLVPVGTVVPGDEVVWTIVAKNVCAQAADAIVIANAVPDHMTYVASSAIGIGTEIAYSLDGNDFNAPHALRVKELDGSTRLARPDEYRAVRWTYAAAFSPGSAAFVRYRAMVK